MQNYWSPKRGWARLVAIIRSIRRGRRSIVAINGSPIDGIGPTDVSRESLASRMENLAKRGILCRPTNRTDAFHTVAHRPGALRHFLADRDG